MSQITENTIVVLGKDEQALLNDYKKYKEDYRLEMSKVYYNNMISIFTADCNGNTPWMIESTECSPLILEEKYEEGRTTLFKGKETRLRCSTILKKYVDPAEYEKVKRLIEYTF